MIEGINASGKPDIYPGYSDDERAKQAKNPLDYVRRYPNLLTNESGVLAMLRGRSSEPMSHPGALPVVLLRNEKYTIADLVGDRGMVVPRKGTSADDTQKYPLGMTVGEYAEKKLGPRPGKK
ncbi:MAG: hypothetical protein H0W89_02440 [Candidatus Levybacteria bacterium]|nr:hypothetical protein [Candidatus Levybacteria bacterium]